MRRTYECLVIGCHEQAVERDDAGTVYSMMCGRHKDVWNRLSEEAKGKGKTLPSMSREELAVYRDVASAALLAHINPKEITPQTSGRLAKIMYDASWELGRRSVKP